MNLEQMIIDKEILTGKVIASKYNSELRQDVLVVLYNGRKVIMPSNEVDIEKDWETLTGFLGREISFIVTEKIGQMLLASRKEAQKLKRDDVLQRLKQGEIFEGKVINTLKYAAYIEIEGVLTALLKNSDFSDGFTAIKEVLKKGDTLKVKLKNAANENKILLGVPEKFSADTSAYFNSIQEGDIVPGVLKTLRPNMCFVNLHPGIDGLASVPYIEVDEDMKVNFEIKKIDKENKKIRGRITSLIK